MALNLRDAGIEAASAFLENFLFLPFFAPDLVRATFLAEASADRPLETERARILLPLDFFLCILRLVALLLILWSAPLKRILPALARNNAGPRNDDVCAVLPPEWACIGEGCLSMEVDAGLRLIPMR